MSKNDESKNLLALRDQTNSMLSKAMHDFNNSLAVIIGQASIFQLLKKKSTLTDEKLDVIIDKINSSSQSLKVKIEDLRKYYKNISTLDTKVMFSDLVYSLNYLNAKKADFFEINIDTNQECDFEIDQEKDLLFEVLNLSFLLHLHENNKDLEIKISVTGDESSWSFEVKSPNKSNDYSNIEQLLISLATDLNLNFKIDTDEGFKTSIFPNS